MDLIYAVRAWSIPLVAKILVAGILFVTLYNVAAFSQSAEGAVNKSFSSTADVNLYGLIDDLHDPDAFESFRDSPVKLNQLAEFYNALTDGDLRLLSSFDQPVPVRDFRGGKTFEYGYGTDLSTRGPYVEAESGATVVDAKSLQINREAFEFYKLQTIGTPSLDWGSIDYTTGVTPVLLGDAYRGVYAPGDTFAGNFYFEEVTFRVDGFLAPDSSIFYKNDINFFLDDYIVVPYPESIGGVTRENTFFSGILYFAMLNGDIGAAKELSVDDVLDRLSSISASTGFQNYALLGVSPYLTQFTLTRRIIESNLGLVLTIEVALAAGAMFAVLVLNRCLFRREKRRYRIAWLVGASRARVFGSSLRSVAISTGGVAILLAIAYAALPQRNDEAFAPVLIVFLVFVLLDVGHHGVLVSTLVRNESGKTGRHS